MQNMILYQKVYDFMIYFFMLNDYLSENTGGKDVL